MPRQFQDLSQFAVSPEFRGRPLWFVQLWWMVEVCLFRASPQAFDGWRAFLLRRFGARVGKGVRIRPSVTVTYPWNLTLGDYSWIGDDAVLYTLGKITIGSHTVISQRSYLCAGSHDSGDVGFPLTNQPIEIGDECWIAADVFVSPGVKIGPGTIVGARSTVTKNLPEAIVAYGNPARVVRNRIPSISRPA